MPEKTRQGPELFPSRPTETQAVDTSLVQFGVVAERLAHVAQYKRHVDHQRTADGPIEQFDWESAMAYDVPYAASKLTLLLSDALSGKSRMWFVANVLPMTHCAMASMFVLKMAKIMQLTRVCARVAVDQTANIVSSLRYEVDSLQTVLNEAELAQHQKDEIERHRVELEDRKKVIDKITMSADNLLDYSGELDLLRRQELTRHGFSMPSRITKDCSDGPWLVSLCVDSYGCGGIVIPLPANQTFMIGTTKSNKHPTIILPGLGMAPAHCLVTSYTAANDPSRVYCNFETLDPSAKVMEITPRKSDKMSLKSNKIDKSD